MSIPTLVIALTLLGLSHALLWHNRSAEDVRHKKAASSDNTSE